MELLQSLITLVLFFLILGVLVLIHEIGHFVTARLADVRVLEFGIGFPPRAAVLRRGGETLYTMNWLPIGGFVRLEGEDGDDGDDPRSFARARLPIKLVILVAGVVMNLLLAFAIFTGIAMSGDPAIGVKFEETVPGSPAAGAGIVPGDVIVSLDGQLYSAFGSESILTDLAGSAGETVTVGVEHADGTFEEITVTLRDQAAIDRGEGALGIRNLQGVPTDQSVQYDFATAVELGVQRTVDAFGLILGGLADLGRSIVTDPTAPPEASGPVGIAFAIGDVLWGLGPIFTLYLVGILSANLALVNILPFPPLDGGRILMLGIKTVAGERMSVRAERLTYFVGFVVLFTFLIWITAFDLARIGGALE